MRTMWREDVNAGIHLAGYDNGFFPRAQGEFTVFPATAPRAQGQDRVSLPEQVDHVFVIAPDARVGQVIVHAADQCTGMTRDAILVSGVHGPDVVFSRHALLQVVGVEEVIAHSHGIRVEGDLGLTGL